MMLQSCLWNKPLIAVKFEGWIKENLKDWKKTLNYKLIVHFKTLFANLGYIMHVGHLTTRNIHSLYIFRGKYTLPINLGTLLAFNIVTDKIMSAKNVNKITRNWNMLKSYAVALVLATTTPVAIKSEVSVQAPVKSQAATTKTIDTTKNGVKSGKHW
jgi:hypothetical protein